MLLTDAHSLLTQINSIRFIRKRLLNFLTEKQEKQKWNNYEAGHITHKECFNFFVKFS